MGKNTTTLFLFLLIGGSIVAFVYYIKAHTPKYKWEPEFYKKSEQPYGLRYVYDLIKEQNVRTHLVSNDSYETLDTCKIKSNLLVINDYIELDSLNVNYLLNYVERGNRAFISTNDAPTYLLERILSLSGSIYGYDQFENKEIDVKYVSSNVPYSKKFNFKYQYLKSVVTRNWSGYDSSYFNSTLNGSNVSAISYINDTIINCFYIQYGKGAFIIHSTPVLFANYNMIHDNGFKNANNIFSYLNNGPIYWNEYQYQYNHSNQGSTNNPLKFLFSHYTLKTGWFIFLAGIFIFILFRSKREQRIIPIIYKNKNTSIEYAKAIGSLYYQKKSHFNIGIELYQIFLSDIRNRYNIITSVSEKELIEQIYNKTEVNKEILVDLFKLFSDVRYNVNATAKELVMLHKAINNFNNLKK